MTARVAAAGLALLVLAAPAPALAWPAFVVTDRAALYYAGYRFQHVSNGGTDRPNHGFESHPGVLGVSVFFP